MNKLDVSQDNRIQHCAPSAPVAKVATAVPYLLPMILALVCMFAYSLSVQAGEYTHRKPNQTVSVLGSSVLSAQANSSQVFNVRFKVHTPAVNSVTVVANADSPLNVSYDTGSLAVAKNGVVELPVTVHTAGPGRYYIMFDVAEHSAAATQSASSVGVAIQVGPRVAQAKTRALEAAPSQATHRFQAQETITKK